MIYYVYSYQKDTEIIYTNYKVSTQFCSFERGVYLYFSIKVPYTDLFNLKPCRVSADLQS